MSDDRSPDEPEVTAEFRARLRPAGVVMDAGNHWMAYRDGVVVATRSGGSAIVGFGPRGESLMLPCRADDVIVDGGRAWGFSTAGTSSAIGVWARDGSAQDLLRKAGLHSRGNGRLAVAAPWVAWFTAEVRMRLVLFNADSGAVHFIGQQEGDLGLAWSPPCLWVDGDEAHVVYVVNEAPGRTRLESYASETGRSTVLPIEATVMQRAGDRLIWRDSMHTLYAARWPSLSPRRTLGHKAHGERCAVDLVAWMEEGELRVDDGETTVLATAAELPGLIGAKGGHVLFRAADDLILWSRQQGRRVVANRGSPSAHLTDDAMYLGTLRQHRGEIGARMTIHRIALPGRAAAWQGSGATLQAETLTERRMERGTPVRGAELRLSDGPIHVDALCARLSRFMSDCFPGIRNDALRPPATDAQLAAAEAKLGARLPEDVRALYLCHDGVNHEPFQGPRVPPLLLPFCHWCSLETLLQHWDMCRGVKLEDGTAVPDNWPWRSWSYVPSWIPVGRSGTRESVFIDLDPGSSGSRGQLFRYDWESEPKMLATSMPAYLDRLVSCVEQRLIDVEDGTWCDPQTREWVSRIP